MSGQPLPDRPDEDLVDVIRDPEAPAGRPQEALQVLLRRHQRVLAALARRRTNDLGQLLSNLRRGSVEDFVGDVIAQAIQGYRRGKGAQFRTYLSRILANEMTTGARRPGRMIANMDLDPEEPGRFEPADGTLPPGSLAHVSLLEAREIAQAALKALGEAHRRFFVWAVVLDFDYPQLQALLPGKSLDNLRKMKERATAAFLAEWERRGGLRAEALLGALGPAMAERLDPDRIRDPKARAAYRAWLTGGLAGAARAAGLDEEATRALLLATTHDLDQQATLRGRGRVLAQVLEIGAGDAGTDPLLARARRTLALVRAALGAASLEAAFSTLGGFVQRRLRTPAEYEAARAALALSPADLRRLLADELDPGADVLRRLAQFLEVPLATLKALPRRPLGGPEVATRGGGRLDVARIGNRVIEGVRGARKRR